MSLQISVWQARLKKNEKRGERKQKDNGHRYQKSKKNIKGRKEYDREKCSEVE